MILAQNWPKTAKSSWHYAFKDFRTHCFCILTAHEIHIATSVMARHTSNERAKEVIQASIRLGTGCSNFNCTCSLLSSITNSPHFNKKDAGDKLRIFRLFCSPSTKVFRMWREKTNMYSFSRPILPWGMTLAEKRLLCRLSGVGLSMFTWSKFCLKWSWFELPCGNTDQMEMWSWPLR